LSYRPNPKHIFIKLDSCSVGDGGIDMVHEVCWFPENKELEEKGLIVYSSAHVEQKTFPINLYSKEQIGNKNYFNGMLAQQIIGDFIAEGSIQAAQSVVSDSLDILSKLEGSVNASTKENISPEKMNSSHWLMIMSFESGLRIQKDNFDKSLQNLISFANSYNNSSFCHRCDSIKRISPFYKYIHDALQISKTTLPIFDQIENIQYVGSDPSIIYQLLQYGEIRSKNYASSGSDLFYKGIYCILRNEKEESTKLLKEFIKDRGNQYFFLEYAIAGVLLYGS
jgi:hypothetical protein